MFKNMLQMLPDMKKPTFQPSVLKPSGPLPGSSRLSKASSPGRPTGHSIPKLASVHMQAAQQLIAKIAVKIMKAQTRKNNEK
jgi:hypothetical protein